MSSPVPSADEVRQHLKALMKAEGVELSDYKDWLVTDQALPAIRGNWIHQIGNQEIGRLDIQVLSDRERVIEESFAGLGADGERYADALQNFQLGSLHVLLSALWSRPHESVVIQEWQSPQGRWTAHVGEFVSRCLGPDEVSFPPDLLHVIRNTLMRTELARDVHWLRTFYCKPGGGDTVVEVLLDNEDWAAGKTAVSQAIWPSSDYYYSLRNFIVLVPRA